MCGNKNNKKGEWSNNLKRWKDNNRGKSSENVKSINNGDHDKKYHEED